MVSQSCCTGGRRGGTCGFTFSTTKPAVYATGTPSLYRAVEENSRIKGDPVSRQFCDGGSLQQVLHARYCGATSDTRDLGERLPVVFRRHSTGHTHSGPVDARQQEVGQKINKNSASVLDQTFHRTLMAEYISHWRRVLIF